jgi:dGTP triphosphohydrolase
MPGEYRENSGTTLREFGNGYDLTASYSEDNMRTLAELIQSIEESALRADRVLGIPSNDMATPNTGIDRIKETELLRKNLDESHWPGGRTQFQIDRDQIMFNPNFVRLARKTQVFIGQRDALYKNRLMHTLEVVQFSQGVARGAKDPSRHPLNPDLVEAIAYGHDIGHTPFGHAGEETLNACLYEYHVRDLLKSMQKHAGSFEKSPTTPPKEADSREDAIHRRDHALWMLVQSMLLRYPGTYIDDAAPLNKEEAEGTVGAALLADLQALNVVCSDRDGCYFNPPHQWEWQGKRDMICREFWIDEESRDFFAHNVHALRVLLADKKRDKSDVTFHTAWGILTHTPRQYDKFICYLPGGPITLSKEYETPEAYLVRQSDDICFASSDLEDAKNSDLLKWNDLSYEERVSIWRLAVPYPHDGGMVPPNSQRLQFCEHGFSFSRTSECRYENESCVKAARQVIKNRLYPILATRQQAAKSIVRDLFWFYAQPPVRSEQRQVEEVALEEKNTFENKHELWSGLSRARVATDFIAHMTDDEAMDTHRALFSPEHARWARHFMKNVTDG